jgi:hypothetical protein
MAEPGRPAGSMKSVMPGLGMVEVAPSHSRSLADRSRKSRGAGATGDIPTRVSFTRHVNAMRLRDARESVERRPDEPRGPPPASHRRTASLGRLGSSPEVSGSPATVRRGRASRGGAAHRSATNGPHAPPRVRPRSPWVGGRCCAEGGSGRLPRRGSPWYDPATACPASQSGCCGAHMPREALAEPEASIALSSAHIAWWSGGLSANAPPPPARRDRRQRRGEREYAMSRETCFVRSY